DSQPNDPQDFAFSAGGGLSPSSFSLDDDSDPTLSNTRTFSNLIPGSGYSLSETVPRGWDLTAATCVNEGSISHIGASAGKTVTCTLSNSLIQNPRQIVLVEDTPPDDPQDFSFTAGGGLSPAGFSLDDDSDPTLPNTQTFSNVTPGSGYSVAETVAPGWK